MPDTYTSQFSGEEIDSALRAAQIISGASTLAELRKKLEIRGDTIPVSAEDSTLISEALTKIPTTSGGGVNPNLLDNWYFGRPVNQRGQTEYTYTPASSYTIDRWRADGNGTITLKDGYIDVFNNNSWCSVMQYIDNPKCFAGKTLTASMLRRDENPLKLMFYVDGKSLGEVLKTDKLVSTTVTLPDNVSSLAILFGASTNKTSSLIAAKLELGDTQTLAHQDSSGNWILNEIPDFGEQLRRCMYYAEKVGSKDTPAITNSTFVPSGATSAVFILPYARKRTVPAINFNDISNYRIIARSISGETTAFSVTAISHLDVGRTKAAILVSFNATDKDYYCFLQRSDNEPAGYAFISADL